MSSTSPKRSGSRGSPVPDRKIDASKYKIVKVLTEGCTPEVLEHLRIFAKYMYFREGLPHYTSFDIYYEACRVKFLDIIESNIYDPAKNNFISFVFTLLRNEATKARCHGRHIVHIDSYDDPDNFKAEESKYAQTRRNFLLRAKLCGASIPNFEAELFNTFGFSRSTVSDSQDLANSSFVIANDAGRMQIRRKDGSCVSRPKEYYSPYKLAYIWLVYTGKI